MWGFLKRQFKTKTGKLGAALIVGAVTKAVAAKAGADLETANMALQIANQLFTPEAGTLGLAAMYLRDGAAKNGG